MDVLHKIFILLICSFSIEIYAIDNNQYNDSLRLRHYFEKGLIELNNLTCLFGMETPLSVRLDFFFSSN